MFFALSGGQYGAHTDPHHLIDSDKEKSDRFKGDGDRYFIFKFLILIRIINLEITNFQIRYFYGISQ